MYIKANKDVNDHIAYAGANIENPTDPNQKVIFDFIEMAIVDDMGIFINTTQVDHFGFPLRLRLQGADGYVGEVGEPLTESRDELFRKFTAEVPSEFKRLAQPPYRIIAPAHGDFRHGHNEANYLARYIDAVWGIEYANQLHIQAQLCAARNRHVAETPEKWSDKSAYYPPDQPANWYAKFWHDHNLHGLSYGFAYDDVWDASASLHHTAPTQATVTIGW